MFFPPIDTFRELSRRGNLIPVYREIMADMDTPVTAFKKLDDGRFAFLLESIEGGEKWGRYSFLGASPSLIHAFVCGSTAYSAKAAALPSLTWKS